MIFSGFTRPNVGRFVRYFLLGLSILGILYGLRRLFNDFVPDSLGETSGTCDTRGDFPSVPNGTGMVATGHVTGCAVFLLTTEFTTYVYVHRTGEADSRKSLVFKYDSTGLSVDQQIAWSDNSNLHVSTPEVGAVYKQLTSVDGVKISYFVGKESDPAEVVAREFRLDVEISSVWLAFWSGVCASTLRSILKTRPSVP
jgi:hypothetical protein